MRNLLLQTILSLVCLLTIKAMANPVTLNDSTIKITHVIDGLITEWNISKFETNAETQVLYSVDNDATNLYLAMKIPNQQTQMKLMTLGMTLYLDKKGKKREGTGIEFPVKRDGGGSFKGGMSPDPKAMRESLASMMIFLKTFGFDDQENTLQLITIQNGINIAFEWDDANTLYVEYLVPLGFLGGPLALTGKPLGIGWKINGMPASTETFSTSTIVGRPVGGGSGRNGRAPVTTGNDFPGNWGDNSNRLKEQSFWTKYTLNF